MPKCGVFELRGVAFNQPCWTSADTNNYRPGCFHFAVLVLWEWDVEPAADFQPGSNYEHRACYYFGDDGACSVEHKYSAAFTSSR